MDNNISHGEAAVYHAAPEPLGPSGSPVMLITQTGSAVAIILALTLLLRALAALVKASQ